MGLILLHPASTGGRIPRWFGDLCSLIEPCGRSYDRPALSRPETPSPELKRNAPAQKVITAGCEEDGKMRYVTCSRCAIIGLLMMLGAAVLIQNPVFAQCLGGGSPPCAVIEDDFDDPAGVMVAGGLWNFNEAPTSGLFNNYDGVSTLNMPMEPHYGHDQYIDTPVNINAGGDYAAIFSFSYPPNAADGGGDQQFGFGGSGGGLWDGYVDDPQVTNQRVFYVSSGNIFFTSDANGPNGGLQTTFVNQTEAPAVSLQIDTPQSLMIRLHADPAGSSAITLWYYDGTCKDMSGSGCTLRSGSTHADAWVELTRRQDVGSDDADPDTFGPMPTGPNNLGVNHFYGVPNRTGDTFDLDYIGLHHITTVPAELSDFVVE